jgi:hypothetical protein
VDTALLVRIISGLLVIFICLALIPAIFYLLTLSRALKKCSPASRTMQPDMVWLLLIPLFNLVWGFLVVLALSKSLGNEFRARGITNADPEPGKTIGLAMCICVACGIIPYLGFATGLASFVLWIVYWIRIAEFSKMLDQFVAPAGLSANVPSV